MTFTADNGKFDAKKKVVELCAGESVELGIKDAVHGLDKDGNDYNDYEVKWFKEDVKGTALVTKKCKTDNEDVAPTWTVSYDDVESAGATGVKYIISFHDYFDPTMATTPCDMTDTIIVIANPKPTDKLTDPAPFCEGTLDKEPEKKSEKKIDVKNKEEILYIIEGLGGKENINTVDNCFTRLRVNVKDASLVKDEVINKTPNSGIVKKENDIQIIYGLHVPDIKKAVEELL